MTINRSAGILIAAVAIAVAITFIKLKGQVASQSRQQLTYRCFTTGQGWGYDILLGEKILIHQTVDPALQSNKGFGSKDAAGEDARIVIRKIKLGETPVFGDHPMQHTGTLPAQ